MPTNTNYAPSFSADIENYIAEKVLPLTQRQLVAYQFGDKANLPPGRGTTYTASRYSRISLPFAPLAEGVPSVGESLQLSQVTATAQQWGDLVEITDVGELTIKHDLFKQAITATARQVAETLERNTFNNLMTGTNVIFANGKTSRAALGSTDVLSPTEINKAEGSMLTTGVPMFDAPGVDNDDMKLDAGKSGKAARSHYVSILHPLPRQDLMSNSTIVNAFSYSAIDRLYNNELGEWGGFRFTHSNMVPTFTGAAAVAGTAVGTGGAFGAATYYIQVTGVNKITGYEEVVYQVSAGIAVVADGSITLTTPSDSTHYYNVYVGTSASTIGNLALSAQGPTSGTMSGQAVLIPSNTSVTLTNVGAARTPPAPPATGVTVYPTFWIGMGAYTQVSLDNTKFFYLREADKSDPQNQLRIVSWKVFYGTLINNQAFLLRTESGSAYVNAITNGTLS